MVQIVIEIVIEIEIVVEMTWSLRRNTGGHSGICVGNRMKVELVVVWEWS